MLKTIYFEFLKLKSQKKQYVITAGFLLLMTLIWIGYSRIGETVLKTRFELAAFSADEMLKMADGLFFARATMLPTFVILMPIFICTLAGDSLTSEVQEGNLKLYLARGFSRSRLLAAKFITIFAVNCFYCFLFGAISLAVGVISFGVSPVQAVMTDPNAMGNSFVIMGAWRAFFSYVLAVGYYSLAMMCIGSIAFLLSTIFDRMTTATVGAVTFYFVSYILAALPITDFCAPYLVNRTMNGAPLFFMPVVPWGAIMVNLSLVALYLIGSFTLAVVIFNSKDIK
ncbi:MAG: ABC transporter permease subunit [Victivallaceae bacterium]|nr:ABC transporter permease subunit [Victivallaceae bacterium]